MINRKSLARLAGIGAAASMALGLFSVGAANADTFVPLPGGEISKTLSDGTTVTVRLVGESATISPSMGSTPVHRNAWVSGTAQVDISGPGKDSGGRIYPGYVVGCQVNIAGGGVSGEGGASADWSGNQTTGNVNAGGGGALSLGPGQAKAFYVLDIEQADDFGNETHLKRNRFKGTSGSVAWADETIGLTGCGGYAQARSFVRVAVDTGNTISWIWLWGQPFSIG